MDILKEIYGIIKDRRANPKEDSYVNYLQEKGIEKTCKKVGEEATESVIAAMKGDKKELVYEVADLWFHTLVLLEQSGCAPEEIEEELKKRFK